MSLGRVAPFPYQKEGVRFIEAHRCRGIIGDDTGLGKTLQALHLLRRNPQMCPAVVVCPASVKFQWEREAAIQINMRAHVLEGRTAGRPGLLRHQRLIIVNYDILRNWLGYLTELGIRSIILDECHKIQDMDTKQTQSVFALATGVPYVVGLSATPLTNYPKNLFPVAHLLWPEEFPAFLPYAFEYCKPKKKFGKWDYGGAKRENLPKLHRIIRECGYIRRLKEDVQKDLPEKIRATVPIPISNMEEYLEASNDFLGWLRRVGGIAKAKKAGRAANLARVGYLRQVAARGKVRAIVRWVDEFLENTNKKIVLFAVHTKMIESLNRRYAGQCVHVNGTVVGRARQAAVDQFVHDPTCRVLNANIQAAGTGVDGLQKVCHNAAILELPWRPGDLIQLEGRLNRIGQHDTTWLHYLIAHGTIDVPMLEVLQEKQRDILTVLDGEGHAATSNDIDILDLLMERLAREAQ